MHRGTTLVSTSGDPISQYLMYPDPLKGLEVPSNTHSPWFSRRTSFTPTTPSSGPPLHTFSEGSSPCVGTRKGDTTQEAYGVKSEVSNLGYLRSSQCYTLNPDHNLYLLTPPEPAGPFKHTTDFRYPPPSVTPVDGRSRGV